MHHNYLTISIIGILKPQIIGDILNIVWQIGCNVLTTRLNHTGNMLAAMFYVSGSWSSIAKLEAKLQKLQNKYDLKINLERSSGAFKHHKCISYTMHITAIDKPGIMHNLYNFFLKHQIDCDDITLNTYLNSHNTLMLTIQAKLHLPHNAHIATIREQLLSYCDDNNLDILLEPIRY